MEIDVTRLFKTDTWAFSGSIATHGANAAPETWKAACAEGADAPLLTTDAELQALRDHMRDYGAWEDAEIKAWSPAECNALLIQMVSGDKREGGLDDLEMDDAKEWNKAWKAYEKGAERGTYSGNLFRGSDSRIYYYLGD